MPNFWLLIIFPKEEKPSTKFMYEKLDVKEIGKNVNKLNKLKKAMQMRKRKEILENLFNDFENLAIRYFPIIKKIKNDLAKEGSLETLLAGSGLSVVGFFNSRSQSERAVNKLKVNYKNIIWTKINK
jgi:4-diphosphocytidyl-2-C-methyl-D-erythritol kinase